MRNAELLSTTIAPRSTACGANSTSEGQDASIRIVGRGEWQFDALAYVQARNFCRCPGSSAEVDCSTNCPDGQYAPLYVEVSVQDTLDMLFDYPGLPGTDTYSMSSTSTMRVR